MKKIKMGSLRRAFNAAGAVFLVVNFGVSPVVGQINDRTAAEAKRLGLDESALRAMTPAPFNTFYPEDHSSYVVPLLQGLFAGAAEIRDHHRAARPGGPAYAFYGLSIHSPYFGYPAFFDRITGGTTGHLFPCTVVVSSARLSKKDIAIGVTGLRNPAYFPGDVADYQAHFLAHEIAHCNQSPRDARESMERNADLAAIDIALRHNGNRAVLHAIIHGRTLAAMGNFIADPPDNTGTIPNAHNYIMGPDLHRRYIDPTGPAFSPETVRTGYAEAASVLRDLHKHDTTSLYDPARLATTVRAALLRPDITLSPAARHILELHREAYDFFMTPPATPATPPVPGLS